MCLNAKECLKAAPAQCPLLETTIKATIKEVFLLMEIDVTNPTQMAAFRASLRGSRFHLKFWDTFLLGIAGALGAAVLAGIALLLPILTKGG